MKLTKTNDLARQRASDKAEAILAGAMQEFTAHGYAATSMDRIATAAGVSKPTLYNYFQDKEGLFTALIQQLAQEKYRAVFSSQDPQSLQGEPSVILRHIAKKMLDTILQDQQLIAFIRLIIGESGRFPELARVFSQNIDKLIIELLGQYLASRAELRLLDPEAIAQIFVGTLVHFVISQEILHGGNVLLVDSDRLIDNLVYLIVRTEKEC